MSDNIPAVGTPIFDRLARERGYDRLVSRSPFGPCSPPEEAGSPFSRQPLAPGMEVSKWEDQPVQQEEPVLSRMSENIHPMDLMDQDVELHEFIREMGEKFHRHYPDVELVNVLRKDELDGTITVVITEVIPPPVQTDEDVNAAPAEPIDVKPLSEVPQEENNRNPDVVTDFISGAHREFMEDHPNSVITDMTPRRNNDGSVSLVIDAIEVEPLEQERMSFFEGVKAAHKQDPAMSIKTGFQVMQEHIAKALKDEMTIDQATIDPQYIGENPADNLYVKPSTWGSDEE